MSVRLTDAQRECLRRLRRETLDRPDEWARATYAGERVTLASLHARGFLIRRPRRGEEGHPDAAYEYRLAPKIEEALRERRREAQAAQLAELMRAEWSTGADDPAAGEVEPSIDYRGRCLACGDEWRETTPPAICPECHSTAVTGQEEPCPA